MIPVSRRLLPMRLHANLPRQQPQTPQTHPVSLTTAELHYIFNRRLRNDNLPDDPHTLLAERITSAITVLSSFCAKLYLLERARLANLPTRHPRAAILFRVLAISQIRPLRILTLPFIRFFRPLSWLLAPFTAMSLPVAVHVLATYLIRQFTPAPPPRPKLIDHLVQRTAEVCENVTHTVSKARLTIENDLHNYFDAQPPHLPSLSDILPGPFSSSTVPEGPQPERPEALTTTTSSSPQSETVIQSPLPALRRRANPPGLSLLNGPGAGITVVGTGRSSRALTSDLSSGADSDLAETKSWWFKAST